MDNRIIYFIKKSVIKKKEIKTEEASEVLNDRSRYEEKFAIKSNLLEVNESTHEAWER